jgi:hypothetical protein
MLCEAAHIVSACNALSADCLPANVERVEVMEVAMPKANQWNCSAPRVELDHRARQARLRLEQIEQLIALHQAAKTSWFRRILSCFTVTMDEDRSRSRQTSRPLSNRRPPPRRTYKAWAEGAECVLSAPVTRRAAIAN